MTGYTADQFKVWQKAMRWRNSYAATALGCSLDTLSVYRAKGCSKRVMLACRALALEHGHFTNTVSFPWEDQS